MTNYINTNTKVCITCPEHGEFWQTPHNHLKGSGCPKCASEKNAKKKKMGAEQFVYKAKKIHGDKYDYSKVDYVNNQTKVCIICPKHGEFWQTPTSHLNGHGCPTCGKTAWKKRKDRISNEIFIKRSIEVHGNKYDYSKVEYKNPNTKVCIICPEHGEFWQKPINHLQGKGCYKCGRRLTAKKLSFSTNDFIKQAKKIHGDKYDYSKVKYVNNHTKVCIISPKYGEFWQLPSTHLKGGGHPKELGEKVWKKRDKITSEIFIEKAKKIHGDKYDYSKVEYVDSNTKVCIVCSKHGEFWQLPYNHLQGKGCPICSMSHLEMEIMQFLNDNKIDYIYQCNKNNLEWLGRQTLDFYLPKYKAAIECQGKQHFFPTTFGSKVMTVNEMFDSTLKRDLLKSKICRMNDIRLIYYSNIGIIYPYKVFEDKDKLLNEILYG